MASKKTAKKSKKPATRPVVKPISKPAPVRVGVVSNAPAQKKAGKADQPAQPKLSLRERLAAPFKPYEQLLGWNKWLAIVYALEALAIIVLSADKGAPVSLHFLGTDSLLSQASGHTVYTSATRHLFDLPISQLLALCLAISAAMHAMLSSYIKDLYKQWLGQGSNPIRWLDNAFSTSFLMVAVALVVGVSEITSLLAIFLLGFVCHSLILCLEIYNRPYNPAKPVKDWRLFILLVLLAVAAWLMIIVPAVGSVIFGSGLPLYAIVVLLTALVFVVAAGVLLLGQYRRKWPVFDDYRKYELAFMILSFAAKSIIAWELFAAILRP